MTTRNFNPGTILTLTLLVLAMALTRSQHLLTSVALPDATLAVFFMAGLLMASRAAPVLLLALAALIDAWAVTSGGASDYCVTWAYPFLAPTYACLWFAGWLARHDARTGSAWVAATLGKVLAASAAAFLLSNLSFYAFSGLFPALTLAHYVSATWDFAIPYVGYTLVYAALGTALAVLLRAPLRAKAPASA